MITGGNRRPMLCRLRLHRDLLLSNDNPENRKALYRMCRRCRRIKDFNEYERSNGRWYAAAAMHGLP